uniref:Uncharacterized protein n=1 Tax=Timema tahoe TaxID=61484 RepID=A0A7R9IF16_9NEOP|nr:unnamed protein product [Timema tahoe]
MCGKKKSPFVSDYNHMFSSFFRYIFKTIDNQPCDLMFKISTTIQIKSAPRFSIGNSNRNNGLDT